MHNWVFRYRFRVPACIHPQMLESCSSQGAGPRDPCPLFVLRLTEILGNTSGSVSGRAAALAASPDLLRSFGNLLEHDDAQGDSGGVRAPNTHAPLSKNPTETRDVFHCLF